MRVRLFLPGIVLLLLPFQASAQTKPTEAQALEPFVVTGRRPSAAEMDGPDGIRTYDESEIESSGVFTLQEFLDTLPRGDDEEQLILVDGVPTELSALTPAMVAAIEVSYSGAMPQYGAYSRGRIINIRLKTEYDGREIGLRQTSSLHADGWRREAQFSWGSIRGPWRVTYSAEYNRNDPVTADERDFSRGQDNRARGGRDFRVPWGGFPAIQAVSGNLNGLFDSAGNPVRVALVPENASGPLLPGQFIAGTGPAASGQRFFNTSPYLYLARPEENLSANIMVNRSFKKLRLGFTANYRVNRSDRAGPPPVTPASSATLVPAAFNPFGQDVLVGLVHTGFGPVVQHSEGNGTRLNLTAAWIPQLAGGPGQARGPVALTGWILRGNLSFNRSQSENDTRDLDQAAFTAALASPDAAMRFNPFVGSDHAANAALYPSLAVNRLQENTNQNTRFNGLVSGPLAKGWGAGPIRMSLNGTATWRQDERTSRNQRGVADGTTRNYDASYNLTNFMDVPLWKDRPWLYRFDGRFNGSYSFSHRGGDTRRGGAGVFYAPIRAWTMRATFGWNASSPGEQGEDDPESTIETLMDPRRNPAVAESVQVISRRSSSTQSSRGNDMQLGMTWSPPWRPGLQLNAGYSQQLSSRATGSPFRPQDVIDNETLFAGRIIREAPTAADIILNQPGRILVVDTTATAVASDERRVFDFGVEFRWPAQPVNAAGNAGGRGGGGRAVAVGAAGRGGGGRGGPAGMPGQRGGPAVVRNSNRFSLSLDGEYPLQTRYEVAEGQAFVSRETGPANRPEWTLRGNLRWNNRRWSASLQVRHNAASRLGTIPAFTSVGADVGYRFENPFWGKFGKNVRLRLGVQNIGNDTPPYADTILGYRGGSAIGTTVNLSVNAPW